MNNKAVTQYQILSAALRYPDQPFMEAFTVMEPFSKALQPSGLDVLQGEYLRLFTLTGGGGLPPYETEYGRKSVFLKTQMLADIAGFYLAFGLDLSPYPRERADFIGVELEFLHWLTLKEARARTKGWEVEAQLCRDAERKFMADHLGRWAPFFGDRIARSSRLPFYALVGRSLSQCIESECRHLGVEPEKVTGWAPEATAPAELDCGVAEE